MKRTPVEVEHVACADGPCLISCSACGFTFTARDGHDAAEACTWCLKPGTLGHRP